MKLYKRLKHGEYIAMSDEEKLQHRRMMAKRWRKNHPEFVKAQNKYYSELYSKTRPFKCVCSKCGKTFGASRNTVKTCPECLAEQHRLTEMRRKTILLKQEERRTEYQQIVRMYKQGVKQQIIADTLGRSQSGVSQIIRRLKRLKKQ